VAAEFGGVEEPATVVGEEPGEQYLVAAVGVERVGDQLLEFFCGMNPDRSASSPGVSLSPSRLASGTAIPMRCFWAVLPAWVLYRAGGTGRVDRFSDGLSVTVYGLSGSMFSTSSHSFSGSAAV
jgi:hypothetical protein